MTIQDLFFLLGGLGLFLYGISLMSDGLKLVAGNRLKRLVERLTTNKWLGALVGLTITAIIQSSTATTVMVVGFVNASLMTIYQAAGVIIGANVGTTFTGLLFILNLNDIAPFIIFIGAISSLFIKRKEFKHTGMILLGFGILFLGLNLMSTSLIPLRDAPFIGQLFYHTQNPIIGILVGLVVTAIIQSSTASLGIILVMMTAGIVTDLDQAIFILYGLNIGTCLTAVIATIGSSRAAKQAAGVHVVFNVVGAAIFTIITILPLGLTDFIRSLSPNIELQLVYAHIVYNVVLTLLLLPFSVQIVKIVKRFVKDNPDDDTEYRFKYIDRNQKTSINEALIQTGKEINRMADFVFKNYYLSIISSLENRKSVPKNKELVIENEKVVNYLKQEINAYLMELNTNNLDNTDVEIIGIHYKMTGYLERIGDLSEDTFLAIEQYLKGHEKFSKESLIKTKIIAKMAKESITRTLNLLESDEFDQSEVDAIADLKKEINALANFDVNLIDDILLIKILNNLTRISGHSLNIAKLQKYKNKNT